ncbi:MAG: hypothetical protein WB698_06405 [Solirubrobacteraceae bacterium]
MRGPSPAQLYLEVARLAHGYRWSLDAALDFEHADRRWLLGVLEDLERE